MTITDIAYSRGTHRGDQAWANTFTPIVRQILMGHIHRFATITTSAREKDIACIGDYTITIDLTDILCRIRSTRYRDLTLRSWRASGVVTELEKIRSGAGRWYFYGWTKTQIATVLDEWMIVDLAVVRQTDWLDPGNSKETINTDQTTGFVSIPRAALEHIGAIVVQWKHDKISTAYGRRYTSEECDVWLFAHGWTRDAQGWITPEGRRI